MDGQVISFRRNDSANTAVHAAVYRVVIAALCAFAAFMAQPAFAQSGNASVRARTVVIVPLTLSKTYDMDFGYVVPPDAGTVVMTYDAEDGSECVGSAGLLRGGNCEAAEFVGLGSTNQRVRIRLPAGLEVTLTGPGDDMLVSDMDIYLGEGLERFSNSNGRNRQFRITGVDGEFFFRVGGTLNVNAGQASGLYEGTFTMEIDYR